jgi:hypothetical protein
VFLTPAPVDEAGDLEHAEIKADRSTVQQPFRQVTVNSGGWRDVIA